MAKNKKNKHMLEELVSQPIIDTSPLTELTPSVYKTPIITEQPVVMEEVILEKPSATAGYALLESSFKAVVTASNYGNDLTSIASIKYSFILAVSKHLGNSLTDEDLSKLVKDYKENLKLPAIQSACLKWDNEEARKAFCAFTMCINGIKGKPHLLSSQFTGPYERLGAFCAKVISE